ncbi:MAG: DUF5053 domain-containing protein [Prevotella sp.]|jgi:hypothetical protein|nr:DUF5053 domain-containing protein [Prevotella sp.]
MKREEFYRDLEKFKAITDPAELERFEKELFQKHSTATKEDAIETLSLIEERIDDLANILKMDGIKDLVSMSYISKNYFGKTRNWIYQRLNGNLVNGKVARFTTDEKIKLKFALDDIGKKLQDTSSRIKLA